jgi:hypothetical protein
MRKHNRRPSRKQVTENDVQRVLQPKLDALQDIMIVQLSNRKIEMFGKYLVIKDADTCQVIKKTDDSRREFRNSKSAAAWCILDKINKVVEANRLYELDQRISSLELEQALYQTTPARDSISSRIRAGKLTETRMKICLNHKESDKYITMAHLWQTRGYNNGTIRTSNQSIS